MIYIFYGSHFVFLSIVNGGPWSQEANRRNSHTLNCRMLIRPPDDVGTENQEARQRYELMQCFTVSQPKSFKEEGEGRWTLCLFFVPDSWLFVDHLAGMLVCRIPNRRIRLMGQLASINYNVGQCCPYLYCMWWWHLASTDGRSS